MITADIYRIGSTDEIAKVTVHRGSLTIECRDRETREMLEGYFANPSLELERGLFGALRSVLGAPGDEEHFFSRCEGLFTLGCRAVVRHP